MSTVNDQPTSLWREVRGGSEFLDQVGSTFGFHDAEVIRLVLDRRGPSLLEISLPANNLLVAIELGDWIDVSVRGFSHQNVLGGLTLRRTDEREVEDWERGVGLAPGNIEIELEPCFGAYGTIRATILSVSANSPQVEPPKAPGRAVLPK